MIRGNIFKITINNCEITAIVLDVQRDKDSCKYICYAQHRLFVCTEELTENSTIAYEYTFCDYCVIPEADIAIKNYGLFKH